MVFPKRKKYDYIQWPLVGPYRYRKMGSKVNDSKLSSKVVDGFPSVEVIRHMNCRYIIETYRLSIIEFAKVIQKNWSYGSMLAGTGKHKTKISAGMARHIELCFLLPEYFLDNKHDFGDEKVELLMRKGNAEALSNMYLEDFQREKMTRRRP